MISLDAYYLKNNEINACENNDGGRSTAIDVEHENKSIGDI